MNLIVVLLLAFRISWVFCNDFKDVVLNQGPVRGYKLDDVGVYSFYGIPYATAPLGEDRFKEALPPPTWTEILNATDQDIACLQYLEEHGTRKRDCLVANVFTPADREETNLPVMVYIHGGAFQYGAGDQMIPTNGLVQHGMVYVNFNYRLGPHGLLCLNTKFAPGNAGAKDQVLALKWVRDNIAQFGGDPENIAISGSSAGASFADLHIVSPMSAGLFSKAALESGHGLSSASNANEAIQIAEQFANHFGIYTNGDVDKLESFYRSLSDEQLNEGFSVSFLPCIELHDIPGVEKFLHETPLEILKKGTHNKVVYMTGFTPYEGYIVLSAYEFNAPGMQANFVNYLPSDVPYTSDQEREEKAAIIRNLYFPTGEITPEGYGDFYSDTVFGYGSYASARFQALYNESYIYVFTYNGTLNLNGTSELLVPYNLPLRPGHVAHSLYLHLYYIRSIYDNITAEDYIMKEKLQLIYYNFCKYGNPTVIEDPLLDVIWLPVTPETPYYLEADELFSLQMFPLQERFSVWDAIYGFDYTASAVDSGGCLNLPTIVTVLSLSLSYLSN